MSNKIGRYSRFIRPITYLLDLITINLFAFLLLKTNQFSTYFILVSQEPVEHSIINLVAPIFINEKEKLVGQYVTSEKVEPYLASLNKCINL